MANDLEQLGLSVRLERRWPLWALLAVAAVWAGLALMQVVATQAGVLAGPAAPILLAQLALALLPPLALALVALSLLPAAAQVLALDRLEGRLADVRTEADAIAALVVRLETGLMAVAERSDALSGDLRSTGPALGAQVAALAGFVETIAGEGMRARSAAAELGEALEPVLAGMEGSRVQALAVAALLERLQAQNDAAVQRADAALAALGIQMARVDALSRETTEAIAQRAYALDAAIDGVTARADAGMADVATRMTSLLGRLDTGLDGAGRQLTLLGDEGVRLFVQRLDGLISTSRALETAMAGHGAAAETVATYLASGEAAAVRLATPLASLAADADALASTLANRLTAADASLAALAERTAAVAEMGEALAGGETRLHSLAKTLETELNRAGAGFALMETAAARLAPPLEAANAALAASEARLDAVETRFTARERTSLARDAQTLLTRLAAHTAELSTLLQLPVPESVWKEWLRGDRYSLPRSVRALLGEEDQRMVARHLAHDPAFRTAALRFLDSFEMMITRLLGDRDGEALAATLMSGDFGALYLRIGEAAGRLPD